MLFETFCFSRTGADQYHKITDIVLRVTLYQKVFTASGFHINDGRLAKTESFEAFLSLSDNVE
jgi:hypothetical protein